MRRRLLLALALLVTLAPLAPAEAGVTRTVSATDPTCGGATPCSTTIQAAITAAQAGDTIRILPGTYVEQLSLSGVNSAATTEADRIVIEADPAAPVGSVVLTPPTTQCTNGHGVRFQQSKFITLRGLTITGTGGQAISLLGGNNQNQAIHLERLRLVGNGSSECNGGITIARGNPDTLILNSLIYANGRNGVATIDADGGPHWLIGNTIHGNGWSGVRVTRSHVVWLVNNALTGNGTAAGSTGGRVGVSREDSTSPDPAGIHFLANLVCGNRLGELDGPALDATDSGNLTPTGTEGPGVSASPGCDATGSVYQNLAGPDGLVGTGDDDVTPAPGSPLIDRGIDPRTLGLDPAFNALLEADYQGPDARPRLGTAGGTLAFDIGAREVNVADATPPTVTITAPPAGSHVRLSVGIAAQATDAGSGVASLTLSIGSQALTATLSPALPPPAPSVTATAAWDTTAFADGTYTLTAEAQDQAGNPASATRTLTVDNTPPDTAITDGPSGEILVADATFSFGGTDNLTPPASLLFAWRLDGGAWSAFGSATTATVTGLAEGTHTFEVKARDLAGNEDPTPASRSFSVILGPVITSVTPDTGPIGTLVTISGANFVPGATTVAFNGLAAVIRTLMPTEITATVPIGASTGPLTVTTGLGTASHAFTVTATGDFTLTAAPAPPATARVIAGDQTSVSVAAGGTGSFTSLVSLSLSALPTGVTASVSPANLAAPGASVFVDLAVASGVAPGTYSVTATGEAQVDGRAVTRTAAFTLEVLAPDTLAVTGRVLTAEAVPKPIPGVTITLGSAFTLTDAGGNFVLLAPPPGANMLLVDGRTASTPTAQYPPIEVQIDVAANGPSRVPFVLYLPVLDTAHPIALPLDAGGFTTAEVKATTPSIPGLEVTIPQGTRITAPDGTPVSQITITPVPVDRTPMPFPAGKSFPFLFTIQPGGAVPSQPLPITFPNPRHAPPGSQADLYFFDLAAGAWAVWGRGTVSDDGTQIVSDPGYGLPRFAWHTVCEDPGGLCEGPPGQNPPGDNQPGPSAGEPVDLFTGRFVVDKTDLVLPGRIPIRIERRYWSGLTNAGLFGLGWNLAPYDSHLVALGSTLILEQADRSRIVFTPTGAGTWTNATAPFMAGAVLTQLPGDFIFQVRFRDGTTHRYDRIVGFANIAGLAAMTDRNGNTVTVTREGSSPGNFGRIIRITEPAGRLFTLAYDGANRVTSVTDPLGRVVQYTYDAQGRLSTVTDPAGGVTTYTYDTDHRILTITDPRGITYLANTYDSAGRVIQQTQADGGVWSFAYALDGPNVTRTVVTDPRGNATTHRFSGQGFALSTTDALGQTTTNEYTPGSNLLVATTDPLGRTTRFTYDAQGNVTTITDPAGNTRSFTYEPTFNRVASITDPLGQITQFAYDAQGNLTAVTDPLGHTTTLAYNAQGQPVSMTDPLGNTTTFGYDAQGNLTTVSDPLGNTTRRAYDAASRLTAQTDPRGFATSFAYDPLNRLTQITDALSGLTGFSYDGNGNLLTVTDARGNTTTHTYDSMDRLATRTDPVGAGESFQYDGVGNLLQHTDRKGQGATFGYDALNRRTGASYADGTATSFAYDAAGRLITATDSVGGTIENAYDALDRLVSQSTALGTMSYAYDPLGRRTLLQAPGVNPVSYAYDAASRLTAITQAPLNPATLAYDALGRRTLLTLPNGVSTEYQYDLASRLTALIYRNASGVLGDLSYQYDPAGNRLRVGGSFARSLLPDAVASATYDAANRQTVFGDKSMTFDASGNVTAISDPSGLTTLAWDARDRLVGLSGPGTSAAFAYDAQGRRLTRQSGGQLTQYLYDGLDVLAEVTDQGVTAYFRTLNIDEPLASNGVEFYAADALGSALMLTDPAGAVATHYTYAPFGRTAAEGVSSANPFQYTGRENDGASGLYYYRARYYHPTLQRFVSEDPIGLLAGDPNLYGYVRNSPTNSSDPLGLDKNCCPDGRPKDRLQCYSRCVHFLLIDPAKYVFALVAVGAAYSVASSSVIVGGETITAAEAAGGFLGGYVAAKLTARSLPAVVRGVIAGVSAGEGAVIALGYAAAVLGGWGVGVEAGCLIACSVSPCSY